MATDSDVAELKATLSKIEHTLNSVEKDFSDYKKAIREEKKGFYLRIGELEKLSVDNLTSDDRQLVREMIKTYKAKQRFWEALATKLVSAGVWAALIFISVAVFNHVKTLIGK